MDKNRLLGVLLFSMAGLIVWVGFLIFSDGLTLTFNFISLFGGLNTIFTAAVFSYFFYPCIQKNAYRSSAYYVAFTFGVLITIFSYLFGSFCFGLLISWPDGFVAVFEVTSMLLLFCLTFLSPGFLIGGFNGVLTCYLIKKLESKTVII